MAYKRLWVISSVLVYVLLGIPVWWHVTSIHRPPIPVEQINQAAEDVVTRNTQLPLQLMVYQVTGPHGAKALGGEASGVLPIQDIKFVEQAQSGGCSSPVPPCLNLTDSLLRGASSAEELDDLLHQQLQLAGLSHHGLYVLFILPPLPGTEPGAGLVVGQYRHAWMHFQAADSRDAVAKQLAEAAPAIGKMLGLAQGGSSSEVSELPISAASQTVLSLSLCNADPSVGFYTWRFAEMRANYLEPLVRILAPVVQISIHSQVLYHTNTPAAVKWSKQHQAYVVKEKELPFFVDSNWNLDSGRSVIGTATGAAAGASASDVAAATTPPASLHWVVFIPPPAMRPLRIRLKGGGLSPSNSFWIPSWGGVVIINPEMGAGPDSKSGQSEFGGRQRDLPQADMQHIASVVVAHLHSLLGLTPPAAAEPHPASDPQAPVPAYRFLAPVHTGFTLWEVEVLMRSTVSKRVVEAARTVQSLARLVQDLPNLEMPDLIGDQVWHTLAAINNTLQAVEAGRYLEASANATQARGSAEVAFSHPAVLAQLNFPESHKLGIYMPYFLPVTVPLLQALATELKRLIWWTKRGM